MPSKLCSNSSKINQNHHWNKCKRNSTPKIDSNEKILVQHCDWWGNQTSKRIMEAQGWAPFIKRTDNVDLILRFQRNNSGGVRSTRPRFPLVFWSVRRIQPDHYEEKSAYCITMCHTIKWFRILRFLPVPTLKERRYANVKPSKTSNNIDTNCLACMLLRHTNHCREY